MNFRTKVANESDHILEILFLVHVFSDSDDVGPVSGVGGAVGL